MILLKILNLVKKSGIYGTIFNPSILNTFNFKKILKNYS